MCTLIALHRLMPEAPLVVAANRDEFYDRPAEGPALRRTPVGRRAVAPLDARAGGTWMGLGERGVFAAITNVAHPDPDPARRSRGWLVMEAIEAGSAAEAAERVEKLQIGAYNPFNLLVADREQAFAFTYEEAPRRARQGSGVFVIGNAPCDAEPPPKLARLGERVARLAPGPRERMLEDLGALCADHEQGERGPVDAACVHMETYGTRSSALWWIGPRGPQDPASRLRFADGAPCRTGYQDFTPILRDLGRGSPGVEGIGEEDR